MADSLVYVVDDDPLVAKNLAAALAEEPGIEVRTFTSMRQLDEALADEPPAPDGLIAGLKIGDSDGLEVIEQLERRDPDLVSLLMTGITDESATARALAAVGPLRHVHKPCSMTELLPKLRVGLERRQLVGELGRTRAALASREIALEESARRVEQTTAQLRTTHTELRTATERLVRAEQLAAVGRVLTGIAHELSRQLTLVGYAEAIKSRVADDPQLVEFADIIVNAQKRLSAMVDEIRDFASAEGLAADGIDREPADVGAVIDEALAIMSYDRDVRQRRITRDYRARPLVALHRHKFAQVVMNLVSNAVLATSPGDTLDITLDVARDGEEHAAAEVAVLTVRDRGAGMPPEILARLGEPFFTTRGDRGSGLGVGVCMRIVEEHGGRLTFESALGRGTCARVIIPLLAVESGT